MLNNTAMSSNPEIFGGKGILLTVGESYKDAICKVPPYKMGTQLLLVR